MIVAPAREVPGKTPATICARPTATATSQVTSAVCGRPRNQRSSPRITTPPINVAHATGLVSSADGSQFPGDQHPDNRDADGQRELQHELLRRALRQSRTEFPHAPREDGQDGQHRAALDHHVEQFALLRQPVQVLHDQQVPGRGDRRNSVTPSMIPRRMTASQSGMA